MWVSVHALSGLAWGVWSPGGVPVALVGALVLHVVLDLIPHWDYTRHRLRVLWTLLDVGAAAAGLLAPFFALDLPLPALLAGILSAAPDLDVLDALLPGGPRRRLFPSHWRRFPHGSTRPRPGIAVQVAVIAASSVAVALFDLLR